MTSRRHVRAGLSHATRPECTVTLAVKTNEKGREETKRIAAALWQQLLPGDLNWEAGRRRRGKGGWSGEKKRTPEWRMHGEGDPPHMAILAAD